MKIEQIDKNFQLREKISAGEMQVYDIPSENFSLYGIYYEEKTGALVRMDTEIAKTVNEGVAYLCRHTAGGQIVLYHQRYLFPSCGGV